MSEETNNRYFVAHNEGEWLGVKLQARVDAAGVRRPLVCSDSLKEMVNAMNPAPTWSLQYLSATVFHLWWPAQGRDSRTLCSIRAVRNPTVAIEFPFLCGDCAWRVQLVTGQELVE